MYILSIVLFAFVYLLYAHRSMSEKIDHHPVLSIAIMNISIFLIMMPIATTLMSLFLEENLKDYRDLISFMQSISVWCAGAGGLVAIFLSGLTMVRLKQNRISHKTLNMNLIVVGLFAGVVSFISAYKHLAFFSGDDAGVFLYEAIPAIDDIDCNAPILLVKWEPDSKKPTAWRCPTGVAFNINSPTPFLPWGSYAEGESSKLNEVMTILMKNAVKIE
ncbi:hypothetical protein [Enterobacter soli]|uniref:hypothetical protein n=1 Tax=Enterobacter soli TaxID=885040 RepID=UPI00402ABB6D